MREDKLRNIIKVLECLKEAEDWLWLRECARRTGLHHSTVSRVLKEIDAFVEQSYLESFNLRMIRLKKGIDINGVIRVLEIKEKIKEI
ncbi:MAG: helix-turn-helix domain-containing protein [Candidatus Aenigmarchaeota archaeon]|nr:helix-turn-helix domain-containing protein [Candidatus Aenigmarchaeota archaeon]MDW8149132.1 helix-turn-helix domain-containing protein [Candidatus Aenigmarchaeota archaeon]